MKEEEKLCRLCKEEKEVLEHVAFRCKFVRRWEKDIGELVGDEGKGRDWIEEWKVKVKVSEKEEG